MDELNHWLQWLRQKSRSHARLQEIFITPRQIRYAKYRLKFFAQLQILQLALHAIEFFMLAQLLTGGALVSAMVARLLGNFIMGWWWGSLEVMRARIRSFFQLFGADSVNDEIAKWLVLAVVVASGLLLAFCSAWFGYKFFIAEDTVFTLLDGFLLVVAVQTALRMALRTFHSGIFSLRRIYQPVQQLAVLDFVILLAAAALATINPWYFPAALLLGTLLINAISFLYILRSYQFSLIKPALGSIADCWSCLRSVMNRDTIAEFLLAGCAYMIIQMDGMMFFLIFFDSAHGHDLSHISFFLYLLTPLIRSSYAWAQLFYFDFKKLDSYLFANFKAMFKSFLYKVALVSGIFLWLLSMPIWAFLPGERNAYLLLALLVFFLCRSVFGFLQIKGFANRHYSDVILTGTVFLLVMLVLKSVTENPLFWLLGISAGMLFFIAYLHHPRLSPYTRQHYPVIVPFSFWLSRIRQYQAPARIGTLTFSLHASNKTATTIRKEMYRLLAHDSVIAYVNTKHLVWFEPFSPSAVDLETLLHKFGGFIHELKITDFAGNGETVLHQAIEQMVLPDTVQKEWVSRPYYVSAAALKKCFLRRFPDGIVLDPTQVHNGIPSPLPEQEIPHILPELLRNLRYNMLDKRADFMVSAAIIHEEARMIFIIPKPSDVSEEFTHALQQWRAWTQRFNIRKALS